MKIIHTKSELQATLSKSQKAGLSIGFVPTMGFLHEGHLSLIRRAKQENDVTVVSVFVNPTQFGPNEDLAAYPRNTERDIELMRSVQTDIVFFPTVEELYPGGYTTYVEVTGLMTQVLCGRSRPTHFRGVTTIVAKLFHIVSPDRAYFGQKDAQQVAVIGKMIKDLDFNVDLVVCPIVREADGLAMSSRNTYLTPEQRAQAPIISLALHDARSLIQTGERRADSVIRHIRDRVMSMASADIDYIAVVDAATLEDLLTLAGDILIAAAVKLGRTRLIDNIRVEIRS